MEIEATAVILVPGGRVLLRGPNTPMLAACWFVVVKAGGICVAAVDTAADDVVLIGFTSGTTGHAKATMHFHRDVMAICDAFPRSILRPEASDVFCGSPPLAFTFGLGGLLLFPMRFGASTAFLEKPSVEGLLGVIQDYRATIEDGKAHQE